MPGDARLAPLAAPAAAVSAATPATTPTDRSPVAATGTLPRVPADPAGAGGPAARAQRPSPVAGPPPPPGRRPPGIEQMDWAALGQAAAGCTACKLCTGRRQAVFGTGRHDARWMVVGEAPGEQEDLQGEPFVGKSGQLLDAMLAAIGVSRDPDGPEAARAAYIANTVKCRPPNNRNPEPEELAQCEPYLVRQIELLKPRIIVAMGRFAVQSLLRSDEAIGRLRGRVHRYQGVPLVVTYHPAYLLRNPLDKARAWEDLCLAREVFDAG
ncbi:MAG: uracil-DNA glycosylase [Ideonella sp.]|nr:uracil-DNA glycosylase [Ideonella sp.]